MSLRDAILSIGFKTGDYLVTRTAVGTYVDGVWVPGAISTFIIEASIQPSTGRDLKSLPDGQRTEEARTIYTKTELKTRTPSTEPDRITIDAEQWEIKAVPIWIAFGEIHSVAIATRQLTT